MMKKLLLCLFALSTICVYAQDTEGQNNKWYVGIGGGMHYNDMHFTKLDKDIFANDNGGLWSGMVSVFVERNFGRNGNFGLRPEVAFLTRGGKIEGIYGTNKGDYENYYRNNGIDDISYCLKARYLDIRIPVFYQFGKYSSRLRPYIYVAPVLGIPVGGKIRAEEMYQSGAYRGEEIDVKKSNIATTYFAGAIGAGLKWFLNVEGRRIYLGLDASYELGFTDTYGKKERDGEAIVQHETFFRTYDIQGKRKFQGFEVKATLGIPLGKRHVAAAPAPQQVVETDYRPMPVTQAIAEKPAPKPQEKPCYSLDEINDMLHRGESVYGKVFCAIDAIQFDFGKSTLTSSSYTYLNQLAKLLKETNMRVEVKGHTDNVGTEDFNVKLSRDRAEEVVKYLTRQGVSESNLSYSYYGMSRPLASNDTEDGRKMNRRVEFEILK
ncbi:MAG: OmpA family protein [Prevotella sp.]|nr:OmpA family protein [Prevotella sp.]